MHGSIMHQHSRRRFLIPFLKKKSSLDLHKLCCRASTCIHAICVYMYTIERGSGKRVVALRPRGHPRSAAVQVPLSGPRGLETAATRQRLPWALGVVRRPTKLGGR